jgi:hypothetical protein
MRGMFWLAWRLLALEGLCSLAVAELGTSLHDEILRDTELFSLHHSSMLLVS